MTTRAILLSMAAAWLVGFLLLAGVEAVVYGFELGSIPANLLLSLVVTMPMGLIFLWLRNRAKKSENPRGR